MMQFLGSRSSRIKSIFPRFPQNYEAARSFWKAPVLFRIDYYAILGIKRTATTAEIKSAYRKQAQMHHPDKHKGDKKQEEIFKSITEAYSILSEPAQKRAYDQTSGSGGGSRSAAEDKGDPFRAGWQYQQPFDFEDFGDFDDLEDLEGFHFHSRRKSAKKPRTPKYKPPDPATLTINHVMELTLEQIFQGIKTTISIDQNCVCPTCTGSGSSKSTVRSPCKHCSGTGAVSGQQGGHIFEDECFHCKGSGTTIPQKERCKNCNGQGVKPVKKGVSVVVPPGSDDGYEILMTGMGHQHAQDVVGDLKIVIRHTKHPVFKRNGIHLFTKRKISLFESLTGFEFLLDHLDGRTYKVKSDPNGMLVKPGEILLIPQHGMPNKTKQPARGDLFVKLEIVYPVTPFLNPKVLQNIKPNPADDPFERHFDSTPGSVPLVLYNVPFTTKVPDFNDREGPEPTSKAENSNNTKQQQNNSQKNKNNNDNHHKSGAKKRKGHRVSDWQR